MKVLGVFSGLLYYYRYNDIREITTPECCTTFNIEHKNMTSVAKYIVIVFGIFLIEVGLLMLISPNKVRQYIRKAGSTNFINYTEITIRMIPAAGLILYAESSKFPMLFSGLGWFMIATSLVLYFVPRRIHHSYALWCADILKPSYIRLTSPLSILFGLFIIYSII